MLHNVMELGQDLTTGCYELQQVAAAHYWIHLINTRATGGVLFASCFFQYIKVSHRKKQSILFPAINECWPSREFYFSLIMSTTMGNSLPEVTFNNAHHIYLQDNSPPCFLRKVKKLSFDQTEVQNCLNFCNFAKTHIQHLNYGVDFSFSPS